MNRLPGLILLASALCGCAARHPAAGSASVPPLPDSLTLAVKNAALRAVQLDLSRYALRLREGVLLDSTVGPTPSEVAAPYVHDRIWLDSARAQLHASRLVGPDYDPRGIAETGYVVSIGEPYRVKGDTVAIMYSIRLDITGVGPTGRCGETIRERLVPQDDAWKEVDRTPIGTIASCND